MRVEHTSPPWLDVLAQPATQAAPRLIGWELQAHGVRGRILETEAYQGEDDLACHASRPGARSGRARVLYAEPGTLYLYLCYGLHHLLNLVCDEPGTPAAVLIRSVEVIQGEALARARRQVAAKVASSQLGIGPGKVAQLFGLTTEFNARSLDGVGCPLRLEPPGRATGPLVCGPRVGVDYAGPDWAARDWRWWEAGWPVAGVARRGRPSSQK